MPETVPETVPKLKFPFSTAAAFPGNNSSKYYILWNAW